MLDDFEVIESTEKHNKESTRGKYFFGLIEPFSIHEYNCM